MIQQHTNTDHLQRPELELMENYIRDIPQHAKAMYVVATDFTCLHYCILDTCCRPYILTSCLSSPTALISLRIPLDIPYTGGHR